MSRKKVGIWSRECARTIKNISRIRMVAARASGDEIWTKSVFDREKVDFSRQQVLDILTPRLISNNLSDLGGGGFWYTFGCSQRARARHEQPQVYQKLVWDAKNLIYDAQNWFGTRKIYF